MVEDKGESMQSPGEFNKPVMGLLRKLVSDSAFLTSTGSSFHHRGATRGDLCCATFACSFLGALKFIHEVP